MAPKMHSDELGHDVDLVRRLVAGQQPRWADLPIEPLVSTGADNAMYRLGHDMVVGEVSTNVCSPSSASLRSTGPPPGGQNQKED